LATGITVEKEIRTQGIIVKKSISHKPDSVPRCCLLCKQNKAKKGWLSFIWPQHYCCDLAAYPSRDPETSGIVNGPLTLLVAEIIQQPANRDIRGITAHKVYPLNTLL